MYITTTANTKLDQIRTVLQHQHQFDIIAVTETWLTTAVSDDDIGLDNYNVYRKDRQGRGGGVLVEEDQTWKQTILKLFG